MMALAEAEQFRVRIRLIIRVLVRGIDASYVLITRLRD
jgi:hypothetical protein